MPLTAADPHHWAPIPAVMEWLTNRLPPDARVLEIGPGHAPFWRANVFVDFVEPSGFQGPLPADFHTKQFIKCDIAEEPLPFEDKSFDFVFCRHTLEDMYNPFPICREMERVGKAGYIETPSPIAELCRGVDGGAPPFRGYHHHRWVIWDAVDPGLLSEDDEHELHFVSKYPIIEYLPIDDALMAASLRESPYAWNTFHLWEKSINVRHRQSPLDYDIPRDYARLLLDAWRAAAASTGRFKQNIGAATAILKSA